MIKPYVYKATHRESGRFYIGSRWANKVDAANDIGIKYFTSSKEVKPYKDEYDWVVLAEFDTRLGAVEYEQKLIIENKDSPLIINKAIQLSKGGKFSISWTTKFARGTPPSHKGIPKSADHKRKIGEGNKGKSKISGNKNPKFGRGGEIVGDKNPNAKTWQCTNIETGEVVTTRHLSEFCAARGINIHTVYSTYKIRLINSVWQIEQLVG